MKKLLIICGYISLLAGCANPYEIAKTEGEMAARSLEKPEQTVLRQKETIYEINKEIKERNISHGKLHFPATCELVRQQINKEVNERSEIVTYLRNKVNTETLEAQYKANKDNGCKLCKSEEYKNLVSYFSQMVNMFETKTSFGVILKDRDYQVEDYMQKVINLCDDIDNPLPEVGRFESEYNDNKAQYENLKTVCEQYDPEVIKKNKKELKANEEASRALAEVFMQNECLEKYPYTTSEKCKCYANAFYDSVAKKFNDEIRKKLEANEKCVSYQGSITSADNPFGFMGLGQEAVLRNAAKKCGIIH